MSTTEQLCARVYYHAGTNVIISSRFSFFGIISVFVFLKTKVWSELELKSQNTKPDEFYLHYPHGDVYVDTKVCALCCIFVYEYQTVKACFPVKRTRLVMNTWWWSLFFLFFCRFFSQVTFDIETMVKPLTSCVSFWLYRLHVCCTRCHGNLCVAAVIAGGTPQHRSSFLLAVRPHRDTPGRVLYH